MGPKTMISEKNIEIIVIFFKHVLTCDWSNVSHVVCREVGNRICVAGGLEDIVEVPSEPKWSPEGKL